ncbi:MAG: phosphopantothenoylcysteine decarboxylase [Planctomycetota bacterium]|jgi:phosphopantothenoylcysteine synthetase/decarboxylase
MRVIVTAGGTREPIDSVRVIANTSTGRLGALVADAASSAGHDVVLLHGVHAALPTSPCERVVFDTHADLARLLDRHVPGAGAVIHAAAVSDYVPVPTGGKLSSDLPELVLRLTRAPKLIDRLRGLCPGAFLVGFKLTSGRSTAEQLSIGSGLLRRARLDLVVVNDTGRLGETDHEAMLLGEGGIRERCRGKAAIAAALVACLSASQDQVSAS